MKHPIFLLFSLLLPFCGLTQNPEEWSGTARFVRKSVGKVNYQTSTVTYTIDIAVKKGVGQATVSYSVNLVDNNPDGSYSEIGSCSKTAETELSLSFSEDGKYYSIALAAPACEGLMTITRDGNSGNREFGADESTFQLEDKEWGDDQNVLKGEERSKTGSDGSYSEEIYTWNFTRNSQEPDLLVLSPNYQTWLPQPGTAEHVSGSMIAVNLQLKRKDGRKLDVKAKEFFVQLLNTSNEPGITINFPAKAMIKGEYDMKLADKGLRPAQYFDGQKFTIPSEDGETGMFYILAYDGGAYANLEVKAILNDGTEIKGHYETPTGPTSIPYPYRDYGKKIAKAWLEANGNPNETDDRETTPGSSYKGDGLTVYEEYRGVFTAYGFTRLSPVKKELGIRVDMNQLSLFQKGINLFAALTNITPLLCDVTQMDDTRILNRNSLMRSGDQYGLYIKVANIGNEKGQILPVAEFKTTKNSKEININTTGIMKCYDSMAAVHKLPYTAEEELSHTVAHFLCRGVGIPAHGPAGNNEVVSAGNSTGLKVQYLMEDGKPAGSAPSLRKNLVGGPHNDASGDAACLMCLNNKYEWSYTKNGSNIIYRKVPAQAFGKKLCASPLGTLINKNGQYFGNAADGRGNCGSHIQVKSW